MYKVCCFCIPLRTGLLIWSYFLQIWNLAWLVILIIDTHQMEGKMSLTSPRFLPILLFIVDIIIGIAAYPYYIMRPKKVISIILTVVHVLYASGILIWSHIIWWNFVIIFYAYVVKLLSIISTFVLLIGLHKKRRRHVQLFYNCSIISTAFIGSKLLIDFINFSYIFVTHDVESRKGWKENYIKAFLIKISHIFIQVFLQLYMTEKTKEFLDQPDDDTAVVPNADDQKLNDLLHNAVEVGHGDFV